MGPDAGGRRSAPSLTRCRRGVGDRTGAYRREGVEITASEHDGVPHLRCAFVDGMAGLAPAVESDLVPVSEAVFAGPADGAFSDDWTPVVFPTPTDGTGCVRVGMRATTKTG